MITTQSLRGRVALMVGHCAGMVDLVALPVWVGTLISVYRFDPQQAGLLATLFLAGAVAASLVLAPFFQLLRGRTVATCGFAGAAVAFAVASTTTQFALLALLAFPEADSVGGAATSRAPAAPLPAAVWWGVLGIAALGLVQSMTFSFLERVGSDRGYGLQAVTGVLIALGVVNLFPAALAAVLEKRWAARSVLLAGPALQALLVVVIMNSPVFAPYAAAAAVFAAVMIFTHTFAFGVLARLDPSGRALAATPAMLMFGAAIGPILGGTLVKAWGYGSLGVAAVVIDAVAVYAFARIHRAPHKAKPLPGVA